MCVFVFFQLFVRLVNSKSIKKIASKKGSFAQTSQEQEQDRFHRKYLRRRTRKNDSDVTTNMNYFVTSSSSWSMSLCNPKINITIIEGFWRTLPPIKDEHCEHVQTSQHARISLKGKPLGSHMVGWIYLVHPSPPPPSGVYDWWTIGGRVHWISSYRTSPSPRHYSNHRWLNLGVPPGSQLKP